MIPDVRQLRARHTGPVPSAIPGQAWIMCSLDDCTKPGQAQINVVIEASRDLTPLGYACHYNTYLFCSATHLNWWVASYRDRSRASAVYRQLDAERRQQVPRQGP